LGTNDFFLSRFVFGGGLNIQSRVATLPQQIVEC